MSHVAGAHLPWRFSTFAHPCRAGETSLGILEIHKLCFCSADSVLRWPLNHVYTVFTGCNQAKMQKFKSSPLARSCKRSCH